MQGSVNMISVAMATYNGEKYLQEQLNSIYAQSYKDVEIVICDDCSSDETWSIIKKNAEENVNLRCFRNESNLGFKKNFEKAISLCKGEFIALSDQDDIWEKDHLEKLIGNIGDYDIACGDAVLIDGKGETKGKTLSSADFLDECSTNPLDLAYRIFFNSSCFQGASMLIRADFLKKAMPFPHDVVYHDTWLAALACFCGGIKYKKDIVTKHRVHGNNVSKRPYWRNVLGIVHLKRSRERKDRLPLANAIQERVGNLSFEQTKFLESVRKYNVNRNSILGKLKNLVFRLKHYRSIYTTKTKIFVEW